MRKISSPGPWRAQGGDIVDANGKWVTLMLQEDQKLAASAPELLTALRWAVTIIGENADHRFKDFAGELLKRLEGQ